MKACGAPAACAADFRLSMSRCTAGKSLHSIGPLQAGRARMSGRVTFISGKSSSSGSSRTGMRDSPPKPVSRSLTYVA
ncbi:MAG TPA: hypothetical protein VFY10_02405 [Dehalococcoidia bacterium]|nr:hypothetical protein [Dehalococcoidia bacterium]